MWKCAAEETPAAEEISRPSLMQLDLCEMFAYDLHPTDEPKYKTDSFNTNSVCNVTSSALGALLTQMKTSLCLSYQQEPC